MNPLTNEELIAKCERNLPENPYAESLFTELITRFRKLTQPEIKVEHFDHSRVVMTKISNGDTYTSYSEELYDFLHEYNKIKLTQPEQVSGEVEDILFTKEDLKNAFEVFKFKPFPHNSPLWEDYYNAFIRAKKTALNGKIDKR